MDGPAKTGKEVVRASPGFYANANDSRDFALCQNITSDLRVVA